MKMRVIAAAVMIPVLLIVLFLAPPVALAIVGAVACAIAAYELLVGTGLVKHVRIIAYTVLFAFGVPFWSYFGMQLQIAQIAVFIFTVLLFAEVLISKCKLRFEKIAICYVGGLVIPYMMSSLVRMMGDGSGRIIIIVPFILAFMADTGAYFIGSAFGKHKLAPVISPKKSIEGLFGGIAFTVLAMVVYCLVIDLAFDRNVSYLYAVVYGIIGSLCGTFGDLCFSAIKRQTGIKDYGKLIPGHGGMLDRVDSLLFVATLTEIMLSLMPIVE